MSAKPSSQSKSKSSGFAAKSTLYQEFLAEREEILKHKWIESEKAGCDIGYDQALLDWIRNHRNEWKANRRKTSGNFLLGK